MKKYLITVCIALSLFAINAQACTTAVISGKYTKDGRPIIWKLRDSDSFKNKMMFFSSGKYSYSGLVNSEDEYGDQVWGGANSRGFAIMNSASFNVNLQDSSLNKDQEGRFMKLALEKCGSLEDFEELLKTFPKPMGLAAHFGVIDANGGASFYEVDNYTFTKFDANDLSQAPQGYILRTNFSFTGKKDIGYGFIRYQTAQDIFYQSEAKGELCSQTIMQEFSRCLKHPVLNKDFKEEYEHVSEVDHFINSGDFITRHGSSSTILIEGVKKGEPSDMATIWSQVGFPNTCISLPIWVAGGKQLPKVLLGSGEKNCPLNEAALALKKECYPISRSAGYKYLNISKLINTEKTGYIQKLEKVEAHIFAMTKEKLEVWRQKSPSQLEIQNFYIYLDKYTRESYKNEFGIIL